MRLRGYPKIFSGLLLGCVVHSILGSAGARAADAALVEAAKKEHKVVWYTTQIVDQFVRPAKAAFEAKYGVSVDYVRANTSDIVLRVINESRSRNIEADVVDGVGSSAALKHENLVMRWQPPAQLPTQYLDPNGYWIATNLYVLTPAFNTSLVPRGSEPRTFDDLLDPKWKGRMAWSIPPSSGLAPEFVGLVLRTMGEEQGRAYLTKLAKQQITGLPVSARQVLDQMIAGDFPVALQIFNNHAVISAAKGAPSAWIPMQPALALLSVASIVTGAPHPNAAKLFIDFLVSEEGQKIMGASGELPVHPNVPPNDPTLRPEDGKFRALFLTPEELDANLPTWGKIYAEIFR